MERQQQQQHQQQQQQQQQQRSTKMMFEPFSKNEYSFKQKSRRENEKYFDFFKLKIKTF